ncbi:MAG: hypothetical protein OEV93_01105 [Candidatus Moranbacteria bacterium]|nr:hypothetical protein [Candidatus Moranbacteria bacterium]
MCFTPLVSIGTATAEFLIAAHLKRKIKDPKLKLAPVFIFLLGLYQFTEFMLCKTNNPEIWSRIGFVSYTFLPIVFMHFTLNISQKRMEKALYILPVGISLLALLHPNFLIYSSCNLLHVSVMNVIFDQYYSLTVIYSVLYFVFPAYGLFCFVKTFKNKFMDKTSSKMVAVLIPLTVIVSQATIILLAIKNINPTLLWIVISIFLFILSLALILLGIIPFWKKSYYFRFVALFAFASSGLTVPILYVILPLMSYDFPSIFCQFAFFYSIAILVFVNAFERQKGEGREVAKN